jgi:hypothetical protein
MIATTNKIPMRIIFGILASARRSDSPTLIPGVKASAMIARVPTSVNKLPTIKPMAAVAPSPAAGVCGCVSPEITDPMPTVASANGTSKWLSRRISAALSSQTADIDIGIIKLLKLSAYLPVSTWHHVVQVAVQINDNYQ